MSSKKKNIVVVIVGPTAVGKTDLSIELAKRLDGEIISADSRLFYRGMDIGTAKPTGEQMAQVKHHLIDCADPKEIWSLAIYRQIVYETIDDIFSRKKIPVIVGGTGQYIRAITEGWELPPQEPNHVMRDVLTRWSEEIGKDELHHKLNIVDPMAAGEIDPTNVRRTIRALEVVFLTGRRFSDQRRKVNPRYEFWVIGLDRPREELYRRIDLRIEEMFKHGLVEETTELMRKGLSASDPNLSAIGYREVVEYLQDKITLDEAKALMRKKTREFVRRQRNWFKPDDTGIHWHEVSENTMEEILEEMRIGNIV